MRFAKTILYIADVEASLAFFDKAFGMKTRVVQSGIYGEAETGEATIAFISGCIRRSSLRKNALPVKLPRPGEVVLVASLITDRYLWSRSFNAATAGRFRSGPCRLGLLCRARSYRR